MLLSGREIQTFCPEGIGCPSVGAGQRATMSCLGGSHGLSLEDVAAAERKYDLLSWSQTVPSTPEAYLSGCVRTASIPALRRIE